MPSFLAETELRKFDVPVKKLEPKPAVIGFVGAFFPKKPKSILTHIRTSTISHHGFGNDLKLSK